MAINQPYTTFQTVEEAAEFIRTADFSLYKLYKTISETDSLAAYERFEEEVSATIATIQAKQGTLYTEETKAALIREEVQNLADRYTQKGERAVDKAAEAQAELLARLTADIAKGSRIKNLEEAEALQAETRTALAFAPTARSVEDVLDRLLERGKTDKTALQFVVNYGYLFADKVTALTTDTYERVSSMAYINSQLQKAKQQSYTPTTQAKIMLLEAAEPKAFYSSASTNLIEMRRSFLMSVYA